MQRNIAVERWYSQQLNPAVSLVSTPKKRHSALGLCVLCFFCARERGLYVATNAPSTTGAAVWTTVGSQQKHPGDPTTSTVNTSAIRSRATANGASTGTTLLALLAACARWRGALPVPVGAL